MSTLTVQVMTQIFPNLWIAPADTAREADFLQENGITHVLNCAAEEPTRYPDPYLVTHKVDLLEEKGLDTLSKLLEASINLAIWLSEPMHRVVVHCKGGISRSVPVVLSWLIVHREFNFDDAYNHVQSRRMFILLNPCYIPLLRALAGGEHVPARSHWQRLSYTLSPSPTP